MNRRDFIKRISAALVATGVVDTLPVNFGESLPEVIDTQNPVPLLELGERIFHITFPNGERLAFKGYVTALAQQASPDDLCELNFSVQPTGWINAYEPSVPEPDVTLESSEVLESAANALKPNGTLLVMESDKGQIALDLKDVSMPSLDLCPQHVEKHGDDDYIVGLQSAGEMSFSVNFTPTTEQALWEQAFGKPKP